MVALHVKIASVQCFHLNGITPHVSCLLVQHQNLINRQQDVLINGQDKSIKTQMSTYKNHYTIYIYNYFRS